MKKAGQEKIKKNAIQLTFHQNNWTYRLTDHEEQNKKWSSTEKNPSWVRLYENNIEKLFSFEILLREKEWNETKHIYMKSQITFCSATFQIPNM